MFDKEFWHRLTRPVDLDAYPALPCPKCGKNELTIGWDSVQYRDAQVDARTSAFLKTTLPYNPKELVESFGKDNALALLVGFASLSQTGKYRPANFVCFFDCMSCGTSVSALGIAAIPKAMQSREQTKIKVHFFSPPVPMFAIHSSVPEAIASELLAAFNYFHSDILSSGAKLRRAIEQFCSELGFAQGTLHHRIDRMSAEYPIEAEWLGSLKLVGNEATHSDGVEEADILNSFAIFAELVDFLARRSRLPAVQQSSKFLTDKFKKDKPRF